MPSLMHGMGADSATHHARWIWALAKGCTMYLTAWAPWMWSSIVQLCRCLVFVRSIHSMPGTPLELFCLENADTETLACCRSCHLHHRTLRDSYAGL